jgi:hypothetical protein
MEDETTWHLHRKDAYGLAESFFHPSTHTSEYACFPIFCELQISTNPLCAAVFISLTLPGVVRDELSLER